MRVRRSGITYNSMLEWRLAAAWAHYTWEQFCELDGEDQSGIVAAHRASLQIEAVLTNESVKKSKGSKRGK